MNEINIFNEHKDIDFHKNHIANLMNICTFCHDELHKLQKRIVKKKSIDGKQSFQTI